MSEQTEAPDTALYFGCWSEVGHGFHRPDGSSASHPVPTPWRWGVEDLTPKSTTKQGAAAVHHKDGWTALAIHDYTVDSRGNSKSVFCFHADLDLDEVMFSVAKFFPAIQHRVGAFKIVEIHEDEPGAEGSENR